MLSFVKKITTSLIGITIILLVSFSAACTQAQIPACPAPEGSTRSESDIVSTLASLKP